MAKPFNIWATLVGKLATALQSGDLLALYRPGTGMMNIDADNVGLTPNVVTADAVFTDNSVIRADGSARGSQGSLVFIDDTGNVTGVGTLASGNQSITGTETITANNGAAFAVGQTGATNPAFRVNTVTAGNGIEIQSAAVPGIYVASASNNVNMAISSKGSGTLQLGGGTISIRPGGTDRYVFTQAGFVGTPAYFTPNTSPAFSGWKYTGGSGNNITATEEFTQVLWNLSATQNHATGDIAFSRDFRIQPTANSFAGASTIADSAGFAVDAPPASGTNATITRAWSAHFGGAISAKKLVKANTAVAASPNAITEVQSGIVYTNEGATAMNYHALPAGAGIGTELSFYVDDADGIRVVAPSGETIRIAANVSAAAGYAESTAIGSFVTLFKSKTNTWVASSVVGTWTVT